MRYGRRRRGFPWRRVVSIGLAVIGALALLFVAVNWRSVFGLYRINRVSPAVQSLEGVIEIIPSELRNRRLTEAEAASWLQRGLADLGVAGRISARR